MRDNGPYTAEQYEKEQAASRQGVNSTERTVCSALHEIGWAIKQMWNGQAVCRRGWNGRGMWLRLQVPDAHSKMSQPYVYMRTVDGTLVPWLCSQTDLLATDWEMAEV